MNAGFRAFGFCFIPPIVPPDIGFDLRCPKFEQRAELLNLQGSTAGVDDAISQFAAWMDLARDHLTEDDWAVLGEIGGMLYRVGLSRRRL